MNRLSWKYFLIAGIVVLALSTAALQADAHWWGCCGGGWGCGGCYTPCYSACYSPCCYSSCTPCYSGCNYGCGSRCGCRLGLFHRGWCGCGSWCGCGWDCGCDSCSTTCGSCSTTCSSCGGDATVTTPAVGTTPTPAAPTPAKKAVEPTMPAEPAAPAPAMPPVPNAPAAPAPATPAPAIPAPATPAPPSLPGTLPGPKTSTTIDNSGVLTVWVPFDAKVTVNGRETSSTGSRRQFISYGLQPGFSYRYVVRAEVVRNGQPQTDTREVSLTAGQITAVAFGFNAASSLQVAAAR